jgi:FtsZ-binding cell division protein ZapB
MQGILSPYFIDITKDACIKSFWRKKSLRTFLIQNHISSTALASWSQDESKREFLDRLFDQLISLKDNRGYKVIFTISQNLASQDSFPDLQHWEDSDIKIKQAVEAVNLLRKELAKLEEQLGDKEKQKQQREEAEKKRLNNIISQQTIEKLKDRLDNLHTKIGTRDAGYDFQNWFYDFVDYFEMDCKRPYNIDGRQIDGSITLDGTTFLVELKFTKDQTGSPDIDSFHRKVTSKSDNTMGIFVSMSGFNTGAKKTASGVRTPLLLMDYNHLYYILSSAMTLSEVINRIKRHAAQTAESYLEIRDFGR